MRNWQRHPDISEKNALSPERIVCNTDGSDVVLYFGAVEVLLGNEKYEERLAQVGPILEELKRSILTPQEHSIWRILIRLPHPSGLHHRLRSRPLTCNKKEKNVN